MLTIGTELHIRHGPALEMHGMRCIVTDHIVRNPLLGRPILETLGLNTRDIMVAAPEKYSGVVDVHDLLNPKHELKGKDARILEGLLHSSCGSDDA